MEVRLKDMAGSLVGANVTLWVRRKAVDPFRGGAAGK